MILIGDIRGEIAKDLQRKILKVIDQYKNKENYYLLVWAGIDVQTGIIMSRLILLSKKPPKMLGTMCYFVDNKAGKIERIWSLPLDIPIAEPSEEMIEEVMKSAKGMPLIN